MLDHYFYFATIMGVLFIWRFTEHESSRPNSGESQFELTLQIVHILARGVFLFYRNHPELNDVEGNQMIFSLNFENITRKQTSLLCGHCGRDNNQSVKSLKSSTLTP